MVKDGILHEYAYNNFYNKFWNNWHWITNSKEN